MKFIRLEMKNLASLEGENIIEFEKGVLKDCHLFSIVGPTGSGKSTILDAICLALYGNAPRYPRKAREKSNITIFGDKDETEKNRLSPTDPMNILTRGQKNGYSKLTFIANDGCVYRAEWHVSMKRVSYSKESYLFLLESDANGGMTEQERDWNTIPGNIIGMDFDQFLHTVLIAQGSFAHFLNAKEDERYALLEKLVGNGETYTNIAKAIAEEYKNAKLALEAVKAKAQGLDELKLSDEERNKLQEMEKTLVEEVSRISEQLSTIDKELEWYRVFSLQTVKVNNARQKKQIATDNKLNAQSDEALLNVHDITVEAVSLYKEIVRKTSETEKQKTLINQHSQLIEQLETSLKSRKNEQMDYDTLFRDKQETDKCIVDWDEAIRVLRAMNTDKDDLKEKQSLVDKLSKENAENFEKAQGIDVSSLQNEVDTLLRVHTLMTSQQWESHRHMLKEGVPCPLCGAQHHPYAQEENWKSVVSDYEEMLATKKEKLKILQETLQQLNQKIARNTGELKTLEKNILKLGENIVKYEAGWASLSQKYPNIKADLDDLTEYRKVLDDKAKKANEALSVYNEIVATEKKLAALRSAYETLKTRHDSDMQLLLNAANGLDKWLEEYNASYPEQKISKEDVVRMAGMNLRWEELRYRINTINNDFIAANSSCETAEKSLAEHMTSKPADEYDALLQKKKELSENDSNKRLVEVKARLQKHFDAVRGLGQLESEISMAQEKCTDWEEINKSIGAEGKILRKIAQCYTLGFLVAHANAEIKKFNRRYELEQVKNSLALRIIDHDRADDRRDTTTLSGGETFIISLGLALGLSSLSTKNNTFGNLFIDEGFGTLDPEALTVVIDALSMMQSAQNKKVGVISHTDAMTEISTKIMVVKNGNSGSSHIEIC